MPEKPSYIVVFDNGTNPTYGMIEVAATVQVPAEVMESDDSELAIMEYLDAHPEDGDAVVPLPELLDSFQLALKCGQRVGQLVDQGHLDQKDLDAIFDEVEATVLDYVTNNWGEA